MRNCYTLLLIWLFYLGGYAQSVRVEVEQPVYLDQDTVYGTLLSQGKSISRYHKIPLLIIIPGSGPTDRNGNSTGLPGPNNSYLQLADSLLEQGIATFRYDKPAVGKSTFSKKEEDLRFEDNVNVALAVIKNLRKLGFKDIFLLGHSQGSLVGMLAAQQSKVNGFISLAGPGHDAHYLLKKQMAGKLPPALEEQTLRKLDSIKAGISVPKYNRMVASLLRKSIQPYLISYFKYDPSVEIRKLDIPTLIIQGGRDLQVDIEEGETLHMALPEAKYILYPDMNHVLKKVDDSEEQNMGAYSDPDFPLITALPRDIADWIKAVD